MANIYESLAAIMSEIAPITKDKINTQQGFKYRGIDDVMNALQPLLIKHGVFIVPEVMEQTREERQTKIKENRDGSTWGGTNLIYSVIKMKYTFYAADGTHVVSTVIGEGMDSGDKASNKAMAVAMKYACLQVFCIPTEEFKDPDAESHEVVGKINQSKSNPLPTTAQQTKQTKKSPFENAISQVEPQLSADQAIIAAGSAKLTADERKQIFSAAGDNKDAVMAVITKYGYKTTADILRSDLQKIISDLSPLPWEAGRE